MAQWTPPSRKAMEKLPAVEIAGENRSQVYLDWFNANPSVPRTVPPIFRDFVLSYTRSYEGAGGPRSYSYSEIVHYEEGLTTLFISHMINGKKVLLLESDYGSYEGTRVHAKVTAPKSGPYSEDWIRREGIAALYAVLAVQAFILYHKPEVIPVETESASSAKKEAREARKRKGNGQPTRVIGDQKRRFIRVKLEAADVPPKERNIKYKSLQWSVRGHYRRLTRKNGERYAVYIAPHIAKRGGGKRKGPAANYRLTATPKEREGVD